MSQRQKILLLIALVCSSLQSAMIGADPADNATEENYWDSHSAIEGTVESVSPLVFRDLAVLRVRPKKVVCGAIVLEIGTPIELQIANGAIQFADLPGVNQSALFIVRDDRKCVDGRRLEFTPNGTEIVSFEGRGYEGLGKDKIEALNGDLKRRYDAAMLKLKAQRSLRGYVGPHNLNKFGVAHHYMIPKVATVDYQSLTSVATGRSPSVQAPAEAVAEKAEKPTPVTAKNDTPTVQSGSLNLFERKCVDEVLRTFKRADEVEQLSLGWSDVTADGLGQLNRFPRLIELDLSLTGTNDEGLKAVAEKTELRVLHLAETKITGNGLRWLATERKLQRLSISETHLSDAGFAALKGLRELTELNLFRCGLSDASIDTLATFPKLRKLYLGERKVTGIGIEKLAYLGTLEWLSMGESGITDEALKQVVKIGTLKTLDLMKTGVTERGLIAVSRLLVLEDLFLGGEHLTEADVRAVLKAPSLKRVTVAGFAPRLTPAVIKRLRAVRPEVTIPSDGLLPPHENAP